MQAGGDEECAVCLNELFDPVITQCAHVYCRRCIETVIVQVPCVLALLLRRLLNVVLMKGLDAIGSGLRGRLILPGLDINQTQ